MRQDEHCWVSVITRPDMGAAGSCFRLARQLLHRESDRNPDDDLDRDALDDKNEPILGRLRPGMSVEPTIDTRPMAPSTCPAVVSGIHVTGQGRQQFISYWLRC